MTCPFRVKDLVLAEGSCVSLRPDLYRKLRGRDFVARLYQPRPWGLAFVDEPGVAEDESGVAYLYSGNVCLPEERTPLDPWTAWDGELREERPPEPPSAFPRAERAAAKSRWDTHVIRVKRELAFVTEQLMNCTPSTCRARVGRLRSAKKRLEKELLRVEAVG